MYLLGVLLFLASLVAMTIWDAASLVFVDFASLVVILAFTIPILLASGLLKDFIKGFRLMGSKVNTCTVLELKRILEATKLGCITLLASGIIGSVIGTTSVLANLTDPYKLGPSLAIALLTMLYALIFILLILPVRAKVKTILLTLE